MARGINVNANVTLNPQSLNTAAKQLQQSLGRITGQASEFQKSLDASTARVFAFGATTSVLNGISQSFKALVATTIQVEKRLIELKSILGGTSSDFSEFRDTVFSVAKTTGQSFNTVADAAAELARQGLSATETAKRLEAALILTRVSGLDSVKSVKALTAAINGFTSASLTAEQITNKLVAVDTAFAVSAQDLAEAFSRAGSTAEDAGVSFDQLLGLVTAVEQRTSRGGAVIGNAFKSIFSRLGRASVIDDLKALGVQIDSSQTGVQKLQALSSAIETVADPTIVQQIKELAGGVYQINVVSAALKDLGSDTSIFAQAASKASSATNEAFSKNATLNESISSQINSLVVGLTSLAEKVGQLTFAPVLKSLIGLADQFTTFLDAALDPEKGNKFVQGLFKTIGAFLSGPGLVLFTTAFLKIFTVVARFAKDGLKSILEIGSKTEKIKAVESGIVDLLSRDKALRAIIASTTATQAQKEQAVIAAIQRENVLLTQQEALLRSIAASTIKRGVSGYNVTGGFTGKGGRRFASGFMQEEATAMMLGAPKGVKAHYGKGRIGGQRFIMNNKEIEIPNFGRNGDSAVIPTYAKGFVPNYAGLSRYTGSVSAAKRGADFSSMSPSAFKKKYGILEYNTRSRAAIEQARGKSGLSAAQRTNAADTLRRKRSAQASRVKVDPSGYAFLVPSKSGLAGIDAFSVGTAMVGKDSIPFQLTKKISAYYPNLSSQEIGQDAEPYNARLEANITDKIAQAAFNYAKLLDPPSTNKSTYNDVFARLTTQKGGKGAINAAIGSAFEAAVGSALSLKEAALERGQADFDVNSMNQEVSQLFNTRGEAQGDFKVSGSKGNVESFVSKILKQKKFLASGGVVKKAFGHIPNFNSMNKGVPVSQIRAHFDGSGNPVAVTNTRDEPNGLKDAISREKKGIGMYAKGSIPNFAKRLPVGQAQVPMSTFAGIVDDEPKSSGMNIGRAIGLQMVSSAIAAFSSYLQEQETPLKNFGINASQSAEENAKFAAKVSGATVQFAAMGAQFGPMGAAIGGVAGAAYSLWDTYQKESKRIEDAQKESAEIDEKIKGVRLKSLINEELQVNGYAKRIAEFKKSGIDTSGISAASKELTNALTEEARNSAADKYRKEMNAAMIAYSSKLQKLAEDNEIQQSMDTFKFSLGKISAYTLDYQSKLAKLAENADIGNKLSASKFSAMGEATKTAIEGYQMSIGAQTKNAEFKSLLSGEKFTSLLLNQRLNKNEIGGMSTGAFQAFRSGGATGLDEFLSKYLDTSKEEYAEFRDSVIDAATNFKDSVIEGSIFFQNQMTSVTDQMRENSDQYNQKVIEHQNKLSELLNNLPSRLKDALSGPKADIGKIQSVYAQAAKEKDPLRRAQILASNQGLLETGTQRLGSAAMTRIARMQGFSESMQSGALGAANIAAMGGTGGFRSLLSGAFGTNYVPNIVNRQLGKGVNSISDAQGLLSAVQQQEKERGGETDRTKAVKEVLKELIKTAGGEEGGAKEEMDKATKEFVDSQKKLGAQATALAEQYESFSKTLAAQDITKQVDTLKMSIENSAKNIDTFTSMTTALSSLSDSVGRRLASIEAQLGKTTR